MVSKSFFRERTGAEIKMLRRVEVADVAGLIEAHSKLAEDEFCQVMKPMFRGMGAISFNKYGPVTRLPVLASAREAMQARQRPYELLRGAVNSMKEATLGFALFPPTFGLDGRPLHLDARPLLVPWKEPFEGARVFAYAHQTGFSIELEPARGTNIPYEGKTLMGHVPSRTAKADRHRVVVRHINSIPVSKNLSKAIADFQFYIPFTLRPSEDTEKRRYAMLRFGMPGLKTEEVLPVMWADCAILYENIFREAQEWKAKKERTGKWPGYWPPSLEFTVVPLVSQFAVKMYKRFRNNTLNYKGVKLRDAETNLAIGEMARVFKHGRVFFSERARDGRLEDYDWKA